MVSDVTDGMILIELALLLFFLVLGACTCSPGIRRRAPCLSAALCL